MIGRVSSRFLCRSNRRATRRATPAPAMPTGGSQRRPGRVACVDLAAAREGARSTMCGCARVDKRPPAAWAGSSSRISTGRMASTASGPAFGRSARGWVLAIVLSTAPEAAPVAGEEVAAGLATAVDAAATGATAARGSASAPTLLTGSAGAARGSTTAAGISGIAGAARSSAPSGTSSGAAGTGREGKSPSGST
jgi:hypothetical protein